MMNILKTKQKELQMIFIAVIIIFAGFLLLPFIEILYQSIYIFEFSDIRYLISSALLASSSKSGVIMYW